MFGQTEPDLIIKSTPWTQKAGANDTWWKPVVETGPHRAALGARDRDPAGHGEGPQDHAPRDRASAAGRPRSADAPTTPPATSSNAGTFMEWAVGKQGELMRPNSGKLMLPGLAHHLGHPLLERRRRRHRRRRDRHLLLSEGPGAEVPPDAAPDGRHQQPRRRHSAEHASRRRRASSCCARTAASRASSRTCTCAARRCRWRRFCRTARSRS